MDRVQAIIERGRHARAALENEAVSEAFAYIAERLTKEWRATTSRQTEHREALFHQIAAMDAVRAQLKAWVSDAAFEQDKLDKQNARKLRVVR